MGKHKTEMDARTRTDADRDSQRERRSNIKRMFVFPEPSIDYVSVLSNPVESKV